MSDCGWPRSSAPTSASTSCSRLAAGLFTWAFLEIEGFHLALPLAVLVLFLDLIPLIGFTIGGVIVAACSGSTARPGDVVVWLAIFLVYQQLQDRVIQPLMYRGGALKVNPAVAIVAILVGANLAGVLGALLAIPTAASLGVVIDEFVLSGSPAAEPEPEAKRSPRLPRRFQNGLPPRRVALLRASRRLPWR